MTFTTFYNRFLGAAAAVPLTIVGASHAQLRPAGRQPGRLCALFGVAAVDGAQSATIEVQTKGVFDLTKEPSLALTAGARVFWGNTNRRITTTATGNFQVGLATQAALAADAAVRVVVVRVPASGA